MGCCWHCRKFKLRIFIIVYDFTYHVTFTIKNSFIHYAVNVNFSH
jgi:hypothetical protein